ncbi:TPA: hypothetical protein ACLEB8_004841 [Pseudomonas aeruginosa]
MISETRETLFPETYVRLVTMFPDKPWLKATRSLQYQIKDNPHTREAIERTYRIAYGLTSFDRAGMALVEGAEWQNVKYAMTFAAQALYLIDAAQDEKGKAAYVGRIRGAFKKPGDMRALIFEHLTALHLQMRGLQIEWSPEHKSKQRIFDILAVRDGVPVFEVECKSFSPGKGLQIPEGNAHAFFKPLIARLAELRQPDLFVLLRITVPRKLPTAPKELDLLAQQVVDALLAGQAESAGSVQLSSLTAPIPELRGLSEEKAALAQQILARSLLGGPRGRRYFAPKIVDNFMCCVEVCSASEDDREGAWWDDATKAIQEQMTGSLPGCLVIRLEEMPSDLLKITAGDEQNMLKRFADRVFDNERHKHLACIVFVSDGDRTMHSTPMSEAVASTTYVHVNEKGLYAESGIDRLFLDA